MNLPPIWASTSLSPLFLSVERSRNADKNEFTADLGLLPEGENAEI